MAGVTALLLQRVASEVASDSTEPGTQFVRLPQIDQLLPGGEKGFLRHVFALAQASRAAIRHGANERLVSGHDPAKRLATASQTFGDKMRVAGLGCFHRFQVYHVAS